MPTKKRSIRDLEFTDAKMIYVKHWKICDTKQSTSGLEIKGPWDPVAHIEQTSVAGLLASPGLCHRCPYSLSRNTL